MTWRRRWAGGLLVLLASALPLGCGGSSGDGSGSGSAAVAVSGTVTAAASNGAVTVGGPAGIYSVRATTASGFSHETETEPVTGRFTLMLPPNDAYVMGFEHRDQSEMHFAGNMTFACGSGQSDHFFLNGRERAIDLGVIRVRDDGSFASAERNPLDQMDRDGDGTPDSRDPDVRCVDTGDADHNGYYDDDLDRDGHHDDDMDRDGHRDCERNSMGHDDEDNDCPGPPSSRTPAVSPMPGATRTPENHMGPGL